VFGSDPLTKEKKDWEPNSVFRCKVLTHAVSTVKENKRNLRLIIPFGHTIDSLLIRMDTINLSMINMLINNEYTDRSVRVY
jgi:hypothetical protein